MTYLNKITAIRYLRLSFLLIRLIGRRNIIIPANERIIEDTVIFK